MSENVELPSGWESKFDVRSGKCYFVNHFTKTTTWDDPRSKHKQLNGSSVTTTNYQNSSEYIPLQPLHGSPYHVYPTKTYPPIQAFQGGPNSSGIPSNTASPQFGARLQQQMEMSPVSRPSPHTPRSVSRLATTQNLQETSFIDTEASVTKINTMFPTVSDIHIRLLLKKYYNREAVVISALQVEKHPITQPGPYATPPPTGRNFYNTSLGITTAFHMTPTLGRQETSRNGSGSPIPRPSSAASSYYGSPRVGEGYRSSPKPHSSPKMKLRYLKGIYPKAEETLILDVLANSENNVQKAADQLISLGYEKRDAAAQKLSQKKKEEETAKKTEMERIALAQPPKIKSIEEKKQLKASLQLKYADIAERIISMALESVDYSEEKACQILNIVRKEEEEEIVNKPKTIETETQVQPKTLEQPITNNRSHSNSRTSIKQQNLAQTVTPITAQALIDSSLTSRKDEIDFGDRSKKIRTKAKNDHTKYTYYRNSTDCVLGTQKINDFQSTILARSIKGANSDIYKGPNDDLLLVDYVTWRGANSDIAIGRKGLAVGSDPALRSERIHVVRGTNIDLCKGPKIGLAKGSIYSQIIRPMANVAVN